MEQLLGFIGLAVLAGVFLISFWRKQKKKNLRPSTPKGSITDCQSLAGPHCGQCPFGQDGSPPKFKIKEE